MTIGKIHWRIIKLVGITILFVFIINSCDRRTSFHGTTEKIEVFPNEKVVLLHLSELVDVDLVKSQYMGMTESINESVDRRFISIPYKEDAFLEKLMKGIKLNPRIISIDVESTDYWFIFTPNRNMNKIHVSFALVLANKGISVGNYYLPVDAVKLSDRLDYGRLNDDEKVVLEGIQ